ncbi:MAG: bifunctional oligoribonuclease/PAP phosphatase NrnA [Candidatus Babeliales bacterium]
MEQNLKKQENSFYKFFNKNKILEIWQFIQKYKNITLLTHFRPDGDGISACAAISKILQNMGKNIETIYPNKPQFKFKRNPKNLFINKHKQNPELLIILDCATYNRIYYPEIFKQIPIINIDHHISNNIEGKFNIIQPEASSTCEILFDFFKILDKNLIDKYVAECLLFGILYDSQVFHTQAVTPNTLRASADLMELGANLYKLKTELISNKNPQIIALWGKMLSNIKISPSGKAAWTYITQEDLKKYNIKQAPLIGFNNFLSQISGIDITLLFQEIDTGQTKVSLRSKKTDVNKFASNFGGGGHKNAAGILSNKPIKELIREITSKL